MPQVSEKEDRKFREFHFTKKDFDHICKLIYVHAGISLNSTKEDMVYSRLARRLRATGFNSFGNYLALLQDKNHPEWEEFVNSLTTNLTAFFREEHHFGLLEKHVQMQRSKHPVTLWCSASSTGEEPYSMAMTMIKLFQSRTPPVKIIATDLDTNVLAKAQAGVYPIDRLEKMPKDMVRQFFLRGSGSRSGLAMVRPELRDMISFRQLNLLSDVWDVEGPLDAIFCRNVMIYFDKDTQLRILERFAPLLRPDGLLFAGHSESLQHAAAIFKLRGQTVYELQSQKKKIHNKAPGVV